MGLTPGNTSERVRAASAVTFTENVMVKNIPPLANVHHNMGARERRMSRLPPRPPNLGQKHFEREIDTPEPEEVLDDEVLFSRLQNFFIAADEDGRGGLAIDEFKVAMRKTVGRHSTEDEMELLFMKVDANCDGRVDWEEYVTFSLLEYKEKTIMIEMLREKPFPNEIREIDSRHRDMIVRIVFYPNVRKSGPKGCHIDHKSGKYITLSKEGTLGIWSLNMKNLKYYNTNHYHDRNTQPWFTDMVAMYNVNMLAVSSTDRDITIFDMTGKKFSMRYYITGFENCITAMDYWVNPKNFNIALLLLGDTSGSVFAVKFETALRGGPFGAVSGKKNTCKRISFPEVVRGFVIGVKAVKFPNVHEDWVNKVQHLPDIDCFLSSCQSPQTALFFGDYSGKKSHCYFKVNKGVLSFDYSHLLNIIVTGGMDYLLRVWNPYVNNKAIVLLKGHTKPVNHVIINEKKNQVISIDKGRSLRVFDLRDQTCLQQISGRMIKFDQFPISAVYFNASMRTTLLAANQLVMLEKREEEERYSDILSHQKSVVAAIYSKVFNTIISACQDSVVSIWDTNTGDKVMQFVNAHCTIERGIEIPVEITAICFDHNGRRLVTGARNGTVHVWNFNNGSCMQKFELPDNSDVTGLVCTEHRIYVTGWGKAVYIYVDGGGEEHRKSWKIQHKEDILSIAYLSPNIIATGAYDGNVIIWSRETGQVYCRLNAFESVKPITETNIQNKRQTKVFQQAPDKGSELTVNSNVDEDDVQQTQQTSSHWSRRRYKFSGTLGLLGKFRDFTEEESESTASAEQEEVCEHPLLKALDTETINTTEETKYTRDDYDNVCKIYESAVEKIIFLETREPVHKDTAVIVTSGAEGWIRFWSMQHDGGLLGQFNASHMIGESIFALNCDSNDQFLFTGDTQGYIKIWDIKDYCVSKKMSKAERKIHVNNLRKKFTFFRVETYGGIDDKYNVPDHLKNIFSSRPPPSSSDPKTTLKYPLLVNSFRAHTQSVNSVDYVTERELVITASADCSVRLWTINGQYIGTFGGDMWKPLPRVVTTDYFLSQIPSDIRRTGSARTLKVMHGGKTPLWQSAFSIIRQRGLERLKKQFEHLQSKEEENVVHGAATKLEQSNILGKSYKRTMNHKMPPTLPKFIETPGSVAVYHTLPFVDLSPVEAQNKVIREIQERRAGTMAMNKMRGMQKKKQEIPAILSVFNKVVNKPAVPVKRYGHGGRIKKVADKYQGTLSVNSPDVKNKKLKGAGQTEPAGSRLDDAVELSRGDVSDDEPEEEEAIIPPGKRASSTMSCTPTQSKVEFKLPSIHE